MSGICAIVNFDGAPVDPEVLRAMAEQCAYRGPDGIHYWIQGNVGFAHLALNATPESLREIQPLLSDDETLCLTADVRVDNRLELILLLTAHGQSISSDSTDADLLIAAYRVWGESCPKYIIGDYAFAIWDAREKQLFCARDVYGIKPLHYSRVGSTVCVASEAQQIIQHPKIPRILDEYAIADFLVSGYFDEAHTMFANIWSVRDASYIVMDSFGQYIQNYWKINPDREITYKTDGEYASHFLEIFSRSVADKLRTQSQTIGVTMSGGMDSTSVTAVAHQIINQQKTKADLIVCSYGFTQLKECDETRYSRIMADELGLDLIYFPAESFWFLGHDEAFTPSLETPFMAEESLIRQILMLIKERQARIWLTGIGGDNLLTGSPLVYSERLRRGEIGAFIEVARAWRQFHLPFSKLLLSYRRLFFKPLISHYINRFVKSGRRVNIPSWLDEDFVRRTRLVERLSSSNIPILFPDLARQANYESIVHVAPMQLGINWLERLGARFCLEARHPFLDRRLAEFMVAIPPEQTYRADQQKFILRNAMRGILPEAVRTRLHETEFSKYYQFGLAIKEPGKVREIFRSSLLSRLNIVYSSRLESFMQVFLSQTTPKNILGRWRCITLELWLRKHLYLFDKENQQHE